MNMTSTWVKRIDSVLVSAGAHAVILSVGRCMSMLVTPPMIANHWRALAVLAAG